MATKRILKTEGVLVDWRLLILVAFTVTLTGCMTHEVKTKEDCVKECQARGAEYVGIISNGKTDPAFGHMRSVDVCECK